MICSGSSDDEDITTNPVLVRHINNMDIYRLPFGGYSVKCGKVLIAAFGTFGDAITYADNISRSNPNE